MRSFYLMRNKDIIVTITSKTRGKKDIEKQLHRMASAGNGIEEEN